MGVTADWQRGALCAPAFDDASMSAFEANLNSPMAWAMRP